MPASAPSPTELDGDTPNATVRLVCTVVALTAIAIAPLLWITTGSLWLATPALAMAVGSALSLGLLRAGHARMVPLFMVFLVLTAGVLSIVTFGSVRSTGNALLIAAVAGAGIFLHRRALLLVVLFSIAILGGLSWLEAHGGLTGPPGLGATSFWITHSTVVVVVAIMVYHARSRAERALKQLKEELALRQRSEQERDLSLGRFARVFQSSPTPMMVQSVRTRCLLDVNPAFERIYRCTSAQVLGLSDASLWADPQQRETHFNVLSREQRAAVTARHLRLDGTRFDAEIVSELSDTLGEDALVISLVTDVSEEKRREALLTELAKGLSNDTGEALLRNLCTQMAVSIKADAVGVAERVDPATMRTLSAYADGQIGENHEYALSGTPCELAMQQRTPRIDLDNVDLAFPDDRPLVDAGFKAYIGQCLRNESEDPIGVLYATWRHPIETDAEMLALLAIFASRANAELLRLRHDREIQELNATLERRVRKRTSELEKLNAELDSFAYSVSHDLKSPLRAIDGFTRLLGEQLEGRLRPDEAQLFNRVLAATSRMSALIADLLALAHVSQHALKSTRTDLSQMALQALEAEQGKQPERNIRWHVEPGLVCWCDDRLARIVLENLLINAIKYTRDQDAPLIEVGRSPRLGNGWPGYFVRDNGVGFDMAYADKLFKPFQRLHRPSEFEGTGIGLATVRRIVERHGGCVEGQSTPGQGAEFRFSFGTTPSLPR